MLEIEAVFEVKGGPALNGISLDEWVTRARYVRIVGPIDQRICAFCIEFVGRLFSETDDRITCWTMGDGAHPRCRHYAVPDTPEDSQIAVPHEGETGRDYVERAIEAGDVETLGEIFGKTRAVLLSEGVVEMEDVYTAAGGLIDLVDMGIDAAKAEAIRDLAGAAGAAAAIEEILEAD